MRLFALITVTTTLLACSTTTDLSNNQLVSTNTIEEIQSDCHLPSTDIGCSKFSRKDVVLKGILYYASLNNYAPRLFPENSVIPNHDNDDMWLDEQLPDPIDFRVTGLSKIERKRLRKLHGKSVFVEAKTNSECVTAHVNNSGYDESTNEIVMITGYCHTQGSVYLSDFKITETAK